MIKEFDVNVHIAIGKDGRLRIESDDVPGLWLSGKDHEAVIADLLPAIKILLKENTPDPLQGTFKHLPHDYYHQEFGAMTLYGPFKWTAEAFVDHVIQVGIDSTANLFGEDSATINYWFADAQKIKFTGE